MVSHQFSWQSNPLLRSYPRLMVSVGFIMLIISLVILLINPAWTLLVQIGVSIAIVLFLLAILLRPNIVHRILADGAAQEFSGAVVTSVAFIGVLVYVNYVSLKNNYEVDLTETGRFTLSTQTIDVLEDLTEPVQIMGFFRAGDYRWAIAHDYLERYSRYTNFISYKLLDPALEPELAKSYNLDSYGLVFVSGVYRYHASKVSEESITNGVMCVTTYRDKQQNQPLISIEHKKPTSRQIFLTPLQTSLAFLTSLVLMPLSLLVTAAWVWWTRR